MKRRSYIIAITCFFSLAHGLQSSVTTSIFHSTSLFHDWKLSELSASEKPKNLQNEFRKNGCSQTLQKIHLRSLQTLGNAVIGANMSVSSMGVKKAAQNLAMADVEKTIIELTEIIQTIYKSSFLLGEVKKGKVVCSAYLAKIQRMQYSAVELLSNLAIIKKSQEQEEFVFYGLRQSIYRDTNVSRIFPEGRLPLPVDQLIRSIKEKPLNHVDPVGNILESTSHNYHANFGVLSFFSDNYSLESYSLKDFNRQIRERLHIDGLYSDGKPLLGRSYASRLTLIANEHFKGDIDKVKKAVASYNQLKIDLKPGSDNSIDYLKYKNNEWARYIMGEKSRLKASFKWSQINMFAVELAVVNIFKNMTSYMTWDLLANPDNNICRQGMIQTDQLDSYRKSMKQKFCPQVSLNGSGDPKKTRQYLLASFYCQRQMELYFNSYITDNFAINDYKCSKLNYKEEAKEVNLVLSKMDELRNSINQSSPIHIRYREKKQSIDLQPTGDPYEVMPKYGNIQQDPKNPWKSSLEDDPSPELADTSTENSLNQLNRVYLEAPLLSRILLGVSDEKAKLKAINHYLNPLLDEKGEMRSVYDFFRFNTNHWRKIPPFTINKVSTHSLLQRAKSLMNRLEGESRSIAYKMYGIWNKAVNPPPHVFNATKSHCGGINFHNPCDYIKALIIYDPSSYGEALLNNPMHTYFVSFLRDSIKLNEKIRQESLENLLDTASLMAGVGAISFIGARFLMAQGMKRFFKVTLKRIAMKEYLGQVGYRFGLYGMGVTTPTAIKDYLLAREANRSLGTARDHQRMVEEMSQLTLTNINQSILSIQEKSVINDELVAEKLTQLKRFKEFAQNEIGRQEQYSLSLVFLAAEFLNLMDLGDLKRSKDLLEEILKNDQALRMNLDDFITLASLKEPKIAFELTDLLSNKTLQKELRQQAKAMNLADVSSTDQIIQVLARATKYIQKSNLSDAKKAEYFIYLVRHPSLILDSHMKKFLAVKNIDSVTANSSEFKQAFNRAFEKANKFKQNREKVLQWIMEIPLNSPEYGQLNNYTRTQLIKSLDAFNFSQQEHIYDFLRNDPERGKKNFSFIRETLLQRRMNSDEKFKQLVENDFKLNPSSSSQTAKSFFKQMSVKKFLSLLPDFNRSQPECNGVENCTLGTERFLDQADWSSSSKQALSSEYQEIVKMKQVEDIFQQMGIRKSCARQLSPKQASSIIAFFEAVKKGLANGCPVGIGKLKMGDC